MFCAISDFFFNLTYMPKFKYQRKMLHPVSSLKNKPNLEAYKRSITYSGAFKWNNLPNDTKNVQMYDAFKHHQKRIMLEFK